MLLVQPQSRCWQTLSQALLNDTSVSFKLHLTDAAFLLGGSRLPSAPLLVMRLLSRVQDHKAERPSLTAPPAAALSRELLGLGLTFHSQMGKTNTKLQKTMESCTLPSLTEPWSGSSAKC